MKHVRRLTKSDESGLWMASTSRGRVKPTTKVCRVMPSQAGVLCHAVLYCGAPEQTKDPIDQTL
jgi:hypothetical protein